MSTYNQLAKNW